MGPKTANESGKAERKIMRIKRKRLYERMRKAFMFQILLYSTILKNKKLINKAKFGKGMTVITKKRSQALEEVEEFLLI